MFSSHLMYLYSQSDTPFSEKQTMFPVSVGETCFIRESMWENKWKIKAWLCPVFQSSGSNFFLSEYKQE